MSDTSSRKIALVTGGSSGLGFAIAKQLAGEGYTIVLVARGENRLSERKAELAALGHSVSAHTADVSNPDDLKRVAAAVKAEHGRIDFLIANAGIVEPRALFHHDDMASMKATLEIDLWGAILTARLLGPLVAEGGRILFISSAFALVGAAGYSTYCAAKAGVVTFADALRRELKCRKIAVHVACPADIDTPQFHYEKQSLPSWMKVSAARGAVMAPEEAARRILARCRGDRLLILITLEVWFLHFALRVLPSPIARFILDRTFPMPSDRDLLQDGTSTSLP